MPKSKCQINVKTQMSNQGQSSNAQRKKPIISF
jgi:hypothetical protein